MEDDYFSGVTPTVTIDSTSDYSIAVSNDVTDTLTINTSSPTYTGSTITLEDFNMPDIKRKNLRDEGELPIDIWAKMYNNGVIDDD